jgi:plastocyanin
MDSVEWSILPQAVEMNQSSLYYHVNRPHVISFDNMNQESDVLNYGKSYRITFNQSGIYSYRC